MKKMIKNKKGVSEIVGTILLILLAVGAIYLLFLLVRGLVKEAEPTISSGCMELDVSIGKLECGEDNGNITIKRERGNAELVELRFVIEDKEGNSISVPKREDLPKELEMKTFELSEISSNTTSVNVVGVITVGDKEQACGFAHREPIAC